MTKYNVDGISFFNETNVNPDERKKKRELAAGGIYLVTGRIWQVAGQFKIQNRVNTFRKSVLRVRATIRHFPLLISTSPPSPRIYFFTCLRLISVE
jgi:hypothetical protein